MALSIELKKGKEKNKNIKIQSNLVNCLINLNRSIGKYTVMSKK
jgi:hypothetical protein